jgi:hypothetical protein
VNLVLYLIPHNTYHIVKTQQFVVLQREAQYMVSDSTTAILERLPVIELRSQLSISVDCITFGCFASRFTDGKVRLVDDRIDVTCSVLLIQRLY